MRSPAAKPRLASREERTRSPLDTAELDAAVGFWLRLAQHQDLRAFGERFAGTGVNQLGYAVLLVLDANPGCRPAELAEAVRVRQPNLVEPLEILVARGLVLREPDPRDRRAQALSLTPEGEGALVELKAAHAGLIEGYREALGREDYERLIGLLRRFTRARTDNAVKQVT